MTAVEIVDVWRFRWPWQTREDEIIRLLDEALREASTTREEVGRVTETVKDEAARRLREGE